MVQAMYKRRDDNERDLPSVLTRVLCREAGEISLALVISVTQHRNEGCLNAPSEDRKKHLLAFLSYATNRYGNAT